MQSADQNKFSIKELALSFTAHAVLAAAAISLSSAVISSNKPIVIDLNMEYDIPSNKTAGNYKQREIPITKRQDIIKSQPLSAPQTDKIQPQPEPKSISNLETSSIPVPVAVVSGAVGKEAVQREASKTNSGVVKTSSDGDEARARYFKEHFAYIRDMIMKNISYPRMARKMGWEGKVVVSFIVNENGHVENIKILESCGNNVLDKDAVETVKKSSPFPKPPVRAEVIIPIIYRLT